MSNTIPDEIYFNRIDKMDCIGKTVRGILDVDGGIILVFEGFYYLPVLSGITPGRLLTPSKVRELESRLNRLYDTIRKSQ